jgi:hypothetical protein
MPERYDPYIEVCDPTDPEAKISILRTNFNPAVHTRWEFRDADEAPDGGEAPGEFDETLDPGDVEEL